MTRRRELLLNLLLSLASIAFCLLAIEVALRFLPVSTGLRSLPVTAAEPVLRFAPDRPFVNSLGWNFYNVVRGRVNNAGFVNDQDYVKDGPPLIAVIGDSFIEAQMVPYAESLQGRLAAALTGQVPRLQLRGLGRAAQPVSDLRRLRGAGIRRARGGYQCRGERFRREPVGLPAGAGLLAIRAGRERRAATAAQPASGRLADLARASLGACPLFHHQPRHPEQDLLASARSAS